MDRNQQKPQQESKNVDLTPDNKTIIVPVVQEQMTVDREVVETAKVHVRTRVREEEATVSLPIISEQYEVRRVPVDKVFAQAPVARYEGDNLVVPVIEEIVVVEKRYKVVEEVHLIKRTTQTPFMQQVILQKEQVQVERISSDGAKTKL